MALGKFADHVCTCPALRAPDRRRLLNPTDVTPLPAYH